MNHNDTAATCIPVIIGPVGEYIFIGSTGGTWTKSSGVTFLFHITNTANDSGSEKNFGSVDVYQKEIDETKYIVSHGNIQTADREI